MFSKTQLKNKYFVKRISMIGLSLFMFQSAGYGMNFDTEQLPPKPKESTSNIEIDALTSNLAALSLYHGYAIPKTSLGFGGDDPEGVPDIITNFFAEQTLSRAEHSFCIGNDWLREDFFITPCESGKGTIALPNQDPENPIFQDIASIAAMAKLFTDEQCENQTPTPPAPYSAYHDAHVKGETPISFTERAKLRRVAREAKKAKLQHIETDENKISPVSASLPADKDSQSSNAQQKPKRKPRKILTDDVVYHARPMVEKKASLGLPDKMDDESPLGNL